MPDKELVLKEKMEHEGLFDYPGFYAFAHSWLKEQQYGVNEEKYNEKVEGNKRDIEIEWKATRGLSDYFKIEHKIKFDIKNLVDVEVEIDGTKKKMNKGKLSVEISGTLIRDPDSKWETSPFSRFVRDFYNKYIIPSRVNEMKEIVSKDVRELKEKMKMFLDLLGRR
ncbi:hypothetical protein HYV50_03565 [Candidatus Pacearchaeota archaeon]|nr:hypothetical protein [Candidatus Pacearchaeota archaeon]